MYSGSSAVSNRENPLVPFLFHFPSDARRGKMACVPCHGLAHGMWSVVTKRVSCSKE